MRMDAKKNQYESGMLQHCPSFEYFRLKGINESFNITTSKQKIIGVIIQKNVRVVKHTLVRMKWIDVLFSILQPCS